VARPTLRRENSCRKWINCARFAWRRSSPSRVNIVASEDRTVHPNLERFVAKRMGATTTELKSSHVPMLSQPGAVLDVIHQAVAAIVAKQG
jgi:hypothetical protein